MGAINDMAAPAEKMEIPADDAVTYTTANLEGVAVLPANLDSQGLRI